MNRFNLDDTYGYIDDAVYSSYFTDDIHRDQPFVKRCTFKVNFGDFKEFIDNNFLHENLEISDDYHKDVNISVTEGKMDLKFFPELYEKVRNMEDRILEIKLLLQDLHKESAKYRDLENEMMSLTYLLKPFNTVTWINPLDYKESNEIFDMAFSQGVIEKDKYDIYKDALSSKPFYIYGCTAVDNYDSYENNNESKRHLPFGLYKKSDPYNDIIHPQSLCTLLEGEEFEKIQSLASYSLEFTPHPQAPKWPYNYKEEYYFKRPSGNWDFQEERDWYERNFSAVVQQWIKHYREGKEKDEDAIKKYKGAADHFYSHNQKMYSELMSLMLHKRMTNESYAYMANNYWGKIMSIAAGDTGYPASHCCPLVQVVTREIGVRKNRITRYVGLVNSNVTNVFTRSVSSNYIPVIEVMRNEAIKDSCEVSLYTRDHNNWGYTCLLYSNIDHKLVFRDILSRLDTLVVKKSLFFAKYVKEHSGVFPKYSLSDLDYSDMTGDDEVWVELQVFDHLFYKDDLDKFILSKYYNKIMNRIKQKILPFIIKLLPHKIRRIYIAFDFVRKYSKEIQTLNNIIKYISLIKSWSTLDMLIEMNKLRIASDEFIKTGRFFLARQPCLELLLVCNVVRPIIKDILKENLEYLKDPFLSQIVIDYLGFSTSRLVLKSMIS